MADRVIASNLIVKERAQALRTFMQANHTVGLYAFDVTPTVSTVFADLGECSFPGYFRQSMNGRWGIATKVEDGKYQIASQTITFQCTAPTLETAYGWFINDGSLLKFSSRFSVPWTLDTGIEVSFAIVLQEWALSLVP